MQKIHKIYRHIKKPKNTTVAKTHIEIHLYTRHPANIQPGRNIYKCWVVLFDYLIKATTVNINHSRNLSVYFPLREGTKRRRTYKTFFRTESYEIQ